MDIMTNLGPEADWRVLGADLPMRSFPRLGRALTFGPKTTFSSAALDGGSGWTADPGEQLAEYQQCTPELTFRHSFTSPSEIDRSDCHILSTRCSECGVRPATEACKTLICMGMKPTCPCSAEHAAASTLCETWSLRKADGPCPPGIGVVHIADLWTRARVMS